MGKLTVINSIMAGLMFVVAVSSLRTAYNTIQEYGWVYNRTIIMYSETSQTSICETTSVSVASEIWASVFLAVFGGIFLINNSTLRKCLTLDTEPTDIKGITFPVGDPDKWDIGIDLKTRTIEVMLNDAQVAFPLTMILGWVEEHEKRKTENMK